MQIVRGEFFFEKMGREEDSLRSDGRAFHKRMEEGKNDLAREADLTKSGDRGYGGDRI